MPILVNRTPVTTLLLAVSAVAGRRDQNLSVNVNCLCLDLLSEPVAVVGDLVTLAEAVAAVPEDPPPPGVHLDLVLARALVGKNQNKNRKLTENQSLGSTLLPSIIPFSYSTQSYRLPSSSAIQTH